MFTYYSNVVSYSMRGAILKVYTTFFLIFRDSTVAVLSIFKNVWDIEYSRGFSLGILDIPLKLSPNITNTDLWYAYSFVPIL